jgi:DNA-binding transcriptional LysR family regulator
MLESARMELRQLEYFVAVAEEANFTRAAERVHISQSGVSAQIRQLERELGAELFDRSGRRATLTAAGTAALDHARAVLANVGAVRHAVEEVAGLIRGRLEVGMVTGCDITPFFDALVSFRLAHPGVEISLIEANSDRLTERVRSGMTNLALIGAAGGPPQGLDAMTIISEPLVAAVPVGHPLAKRVRVSLADLSEFPIVCMPEGAGIRLVFDEACAAEGVERNIELQASSPSAVVNLALRGLGVAILSESMTADHKRDLKALAIADIEIPAVLALIWKGTGNPACRELVQHCREAFHQTRSPTRANQSP